MSVTSLNAFIRASDALVAYRVRFDNLDDELHDVFKLEIRKRELERLWDKVNSTYEVCLNTLESSEFKVVAEKYQATSYEYIECGGSISKKIRTLESASKTNEPPTANLNSDTSEHNLTLPPCDIDSFVGDYVSWPAFRDLFTAIYINSSRLSNIERLCHLIRKTEGEAKTIVSRYPLNNNSFELAWRDLRNTYENPRMLVHNQLKLLFSLPAFDKESITALKTLQSGIDSFLTALSIYNVPTDNWDPIIVFMCIQRLPSSTIILWEQGIKDKLSLSSWKDLDNFLKERILTLQCLQEIKGTNSTNMESSLQSHNSSVKISCILCPNQSHYLRNCRRFKSLSISDRISTVNEHNFCTNCLSRTHTARSCKINNNCYICNNRHHSMLHLQHLENSVVERPTVSTEQNSGAVLRPTNSHYQQSHTSNNVTPNSQVFHTSQNQSVLLGTATVNIIHNNNKHQVRALIDSGSECYYISERLRKRLKLPTHSAHAQVSGINNVVIGVSKYCPVEIGSDLDSSVNLSTNAFVLPKISGNLPSTSVNIDIKKLLPNLRLADSNLLDSRPVDILIGADLYHRIILPEVQQNILGSLLAQKTVFGWILTGPANPRDFESHIANLQYTTWSNAS
ncbi:uncharacterized protein LOC119613829 [Lucilia sericata]|uniref:uncharacterized protein LOC119613028 n=1 Tax=Lucilia sericata TaxID=13632 RepID=UPI0018A805A5|nr:uncharacterized protein LOC119613028 [Lucilia sericata]XP_037825813.1 uncharacterized protein LOC119613829 [Lucilia sericata]